MSFRMQATFDLDELARCVTTVRRLWQNYVTDPTITVVKDKRNLVHPLLAEQLAPYRVSGR